MCVCLLLGLQQTGADRDSPSRVLRGRAEPAATETVGSDCLPTSGLNFAPSPSRVGGFVPEPLSVRCVPDRGRDGLGTAPIGTRDGVLDDTDVAAVASTGVLEAMSTVEAVVAVAVAYQLWRRICPLHSHMTSQNMLPEPRKSRLRQTRL